MLGLAAICKVRFVDGLPLLLPPPGT